MAEGKPKFTATYEKGAAIIKNIYDSGINTIKRGSADTLLQALVDMDKAIYGMTIQDEKNYGIARSQKYCPTLRRDVAELKKGGPKGFAALKKIVGYIDGIIGEAQTPSGLPSELVLYAGRVKGKKKLDPRYKTMNTLDIMKNMAGVADKKAALEDMVGHTEEDEEE